MIKKLENKKGDLPVTLLVIGIFALCGFALLTFFISDFKTTNSFVGLSVLQNVNSKIDGYNFYKEAGVSQDKLDIYFNITKEHSRRYIYEEKMSNMGGFLFFGGKPTLLFSVKYQVRS